MKFLNVLCFFGLLVSYAGSVYTSRTYILGSSSEARLEILANVADASPNKIRAIIENSKDRQLILDELKYQENFISTKIQGMKQLNSWVAQRSLIELVLWIIVAVVFTLLQMRLYVLSKQV